MDFNACDACGARSYVFVDMPGDREIEYCGHHATKYWAELHKQALRVVDLRHMIPSGRAGQE